MTEGWRALSFRNVLEVVGVTPLGVMIMYLAMSLLALLRYANDSRSLLRLNWPFSRSLLPLTRTSCGPQHGPRDARLLGKRPSAERAAIQRVFHRHHLRRMLPDHGHW
jgi:hypothetical protein